MLFDLLANTAKQLPSKAAIIDAEGELSYHQLYASSVNLAEELKQHGVLEGTPVAIVLPNSRDFLIAVYAIVYLGAIAVPLNPQYKAAEITTYLDDAKAKVVLSSEAFKTLCQNAVDALHFDCTCITDIQKKHEATELSDFHHQTFDGDGLYQYSTGSTGTPKRVVRTQRDMANEALNFHLTVNTHSDDRILAVAPFFHAHGFGNCLLAAVQVGATLIAPGPFEKRERVLKSLLEDGITLFPGVPFMFSILADAPSITKTELPSLRLAFSAGAQLNQETYDSFLTKFNVPIKQLYGSTETGSMTINLGSTEGDLWQSVGQPIRNVAVSIVDERGQAIETGEVGEVVIQSNAMTRGYANLDEVNKSTFVNGQFFTGDLGKLDSQGNLFITGRKKLFINAAGNKVDPGEIESKILQHPKVDEVVVVGLKSAYGLETIKAVIVTNDTCEGQEIKEWCQGKMADFKIPRVVEFRSEIPKSPLGKVLRKYLLEEA